jgi:hypothetical protein
MNETLIQEEAKPNEEFSEQSRRKRNAPEGERSQTKQKQQ